MSRFVVFCFRTSLLFVCTSFRQSFSCFFCFSSSASSQRFMWVVRRRPAQRKARRGTYSRAPHRFSVQNFKNSHHLPFHKLNFFLDHRPADGRGCQRYFRAFLVPRECIILTAVWPLLFPWSPKRMRNWKSCANTHKQAVVYHSRQICWRQNIEER